jgi:hypothetical protein
MALTRVRANQISDIDYKQAVRVITLTNVVLAGGAPSQVDSVNLSLNDRVLVAGQSTASQNGLYIVATVGTGSNGTWVRSSDGNVTGEIEAGMIVMVTEGDTYADISWKLITNNPIVIGVTGLIFAQNTGNSFGVINANGTPVVANGVTSTALFESGNNIIISGNAASDTITFAVNNTPTFASISVTGNIVAPNVAIDRGVAGTNWDSLINMGTYSVNYASWSGTTGTPVDSSVFVGLLSVLTSGSTTTQTFYPGTVTLNDVKIQWDRTLYSGTWTAWYKIINDFQVVDAGTY